MDSEKNVITICAKVQVLTDDTQSQLLLETLTTYRDVCQYISDFVFETKTLKQRKINNELYYKIREQFGFGAQMTQSAIKTVIAAYRAIKTNQKKWIKAEFKKLQYDLVWNRDYSLNSDRSVFSVGTLQGRVKLPFYIKGMEKFFSSDRKFGTAKLVYKNGKFFLHIPVDVPVELLANKDINNIVGVDRGIRFVVTTYDSKGKTKFISGKQLQQKRKKFIRVRKQLQHRQTPSSLRRLKKIGQRENRWMRDVNHCISKALVEQFPKGTMFVLEDLTGIKEKTIKKKKKKQRAEHNSWAYYDLEQKLIYKAQLKGQTVVKVSPYYTSQKCPKCGHTEKNNRDKKNHSFKCVNCGYKSNDDRIGAMNLYQKGLSLIEPTDIVAME